jgi:hypothetical protein
MDPSENSIELAVGQAEDANAEEMRPLMVSLRDSAAEGAQSRSASGGIPQGGGENWSLYHCPPEGETIEECKHRLSETVSLKKRWYGELLSEALLIYRTQ